MGTSGSSHSHLGSLSAAWLAVKDILSWFTRLVIPTPQDFREAGVYLGRMRE
jgi:hypothetical protein